jgi:hypothetical protein
VVGTGFFFSPRAKRRTQTPGIYGKSTKDLAG